MLADVSSLYPSHESDLHLQGTCLVSQFCHINTNNTCEIEKQGGAWTRRYSSFDGLSLRWRRCRRVGRTSFAGRGFNEWTLDYLIAPTNNFLGSCPNQAPPLVCDCDTRPDNTSTDTGEPVPELQYLTGSQSSRMRPSKAWMSLSFSQYSFHRDLALLCHY